MQQSVAMALRCMLLVLALVAAAQAQDYEFPAGFYFSSATASYQVEGGWNASGKGENIWDYLSHHHPELVLDGSSGDVACDSYHKYKEDVKLIKSLGMNMYRFSLSWSRILPTGAIDYINEDGIQYYNNLIDELIANKIVPMVTLFHWDLPQPLMDIGGWPNEDLVDYYVDYAELAFKRFGDRVKHWITMNEPMSICSEGWGSASKAPAIHMEAIGDYLCAHTVLLAHGKAYQLYKNSFKAEQKGQVGITINSDFFQPKDANNPDDVAATERAQQWSMGWYANAIFSKDGDYPAVMREMVLAQSLKEGLKRSRLPTFTAEQIAMLKGSSDFFGINHYTTQEATYMWYQAPGRAKARDGNFTSGFNAAWTTTLATWMRETPWGLRGLLQWVKKTYIDIPIIITENGCPDRGQLKDVQRTRYYRGYLNALLEAIHIDKVNVFGYTAWSLMDNYEWLYGYEHKFGIHYVDFNDPNRPRTPKMSAKFFQEVISTNKVPATDPDFPDDTVTTKGGSGTTAAMRTTPDSRTAAPTATSRPNGASGPRAGYTACILAAVTAALLSKAHA